MSTPLSTRLLPRWLTALASRSVCLAQWLKYTRFQPLATRSNATADSSLYHAQSLATRPSVIVGNNHRRSVLFRAPAAVITLTLALLVSACGEETTNPSRTEVLKQLNCMAGSELKDLEPLLPEIQRVTGIRLNLTYVGTLESVERLHAGETFDCAWLSHAKYLLLNPNTRDKVRAVEKTMLSPVVIGLKPETLSRLGWDAHSLSWKQIATAAQQEQLHFAMSNPSASNSGLTALIAVATALAGTGDALTTAEANSNSLRGFAQGQQLTAGSSGWLAEAYVRDQAQLDGMINYESLLLALNRSGQLPQALTLVYPSEGVISADYPLILLDETRRPLYEQLLQHLRSPTIQQYLAEQTLRRPLNPNIQVSPELQHPVLELPFPGSLEVVDTLLDNFLDRQRRPAHSYWLIDSSGSMNGARLRQAQQALLSLTGIDQSLTGRYSRLREREQLSLLEFDHQVKQIQHYHLQANSQAQTLQQLQQQIQQLQAAGGTAIYSALQQTLNLIERDYAQDPQRMYSILLLTDGANTQGLPYSALLRNYQALEQRGIRVRIFSILFGDASSSELQALADLSGGRVFDARNTALSKVFKEIRGYQ